MVPVPVEEVLLLMHRLRSWPHQSLQRLQISYQTSLWTSRQEWRWCCHCKSYAGKCEREESCVGLEIAGAGRLTLYLLSSSRPLSLHAHCAIILEPTSYCCSGPLPIGKLNPCSDLRPIMSWLRSVSLGDLPRFLAIISLKKVRCQHLRPTRYCAESRYERAALSLALVAILASPPEGSWIVFLLIKQFKASGMILLDPSVQTKPCHPTLFRLSPMQTAQFYSNSHHLDVGTTCDDNVPQRARPSSFMSILQYPTNQNFAQVLVCTSTALNTHFGRTA
ncbi:hypothetical protein BJ138DRAFT_266041 [Hygrophoropsis aurantiaca]|uniref:Uncharacterized protein n=1 Tax=Hygrophoropsis aurantiaca TaxID=72124 RepID=A0ACB8APH0_9AGAM|nr:hypothetical protein BJ138DRAFT_266041 [Hygrophoropsis aurantiaca]